MKEQNIPPFADIQEEPRIQHNHKVYIYIYIEKEKEKKYNTCM